MVRWEWRNTPIRTARVPGSFLALFLAGALAAAAQTPDAPQCRLSHLAVCVRHVAQDEAGIVTSPLRATAPDLLWILPFGAATGVAVHYDTQAIQDLGVHPNREHDFEELSTGGGLYLPFGASAAAYFAGTVRHNDYLTETAVLSAEAMADAGILDEGLKYALDREGPQLDNARGGLWPDGPKGWPNSPSMPSEHAMNVWSFAHVVAGQYSGIATQAIVYGLASTVSVSRVIARQHFPSDVVVGSTLGWLVGGYVLHHRSLEHGSLVNLSEVQTPLGNGLELRLNLSRPH
ncbi:MAG TPA: phosphatase PAP2 family protein [Acidobacteriaceae bacterium]|nr:phosphatase PAP2 family protein [Acidobacteriaceae bacterium]